MVAAVYRSPVLPMWQPHLQVEFIRCLSGLGEPIDSMDCSMVRYGQRAVGILARSDGEGFGRLLPDCFT
jgi:hypothetical protein